MLGESGPSQPFSAIEKYYIHPFSGANLKDACWLVANESVFLVGLPKPKQLFGAYLPFTTKKRGPTT